MTGVHGLLGCAAVNIYIVVGPGGDVPECRGAAFGQGSHFCGFQHPVPQVELGELPHQGLGGVEPTTQGVLGKKRDERESGEEPAGN